MTKIGSNIKKIRQTKGLSQQAFADVFAITRGNISSYEENRAEPKIETILKIANYFSISVEHLLVKDLSINEILQYNADKILDDEQKLKQYKLKDIPFISDDVLAKVWHGEMDFGLLDECPKLCLPDSSYNPMLALSFHAAIPHHVVFEEYKPSDILIFKDINSDNKHLSPGRQGMFLQENRIKLGVYQLEEQGLVLSVHEDNSLEVALYPDTCFWMLHSLFQIKF